MPRSNPSASSTAAAPRLGFGLASATLLMAVGLMLSACNTTAGAGRDVSATGSAITRGANDVKSGL